MNRSEMDEATKLQRWGPGVTRLTEEEFLEKVAAHPFPNVRVMCDLHRPMKYTGKGFVECTKPECQEVMARRREEMRGAGAPTPEQKARWLAGLTGRAEPKPSLREEG